MNFEKAKYVEYSSLVIGSKHIPIPATYVSRKTNQVISAKIFTRKN